MSLSYMDLNHQNSLEDMVCLKDVKTEKKLKELQKDGYFVGFTVDQWKSSYPSINPRFIWCRKTEMFPQSLLYYDKKHHICFDTSIVNGRMLMPPKKGVSPDKQLADIVEHMMQDYKNKEWMKLLIPSYSEESGLLVISLAKDILHDEKPSSDFYNTFIDLYSMCQCGSTLLDVKDLASLEECKSDEQKAATAEKLKDFPDTITVYRGEGSKSTSANKACSWTTDLQTAYFFASWRSAEGSKVLTGTIRKEDIIEYLSDGNEYEAIVRPGSVTVTDTEYCFNWSDFITLINEEYPMFARSGLVRGMTASGIIPVIGKLYEKNGRIGDHDMEHTIRVALLSSALFRILYNEGALEGDNKSIMRMFQKLITAAEWHDIGRKTDGIESEHGVASRELYEETMEADPMVSFLIEYHCRPDDDAESFIEKNFKKDERPLLLTAYQILKDADALDRWRFGKSCMDFVDVKYLRLHQSKLMMPVAANLLRVDFARYLQ